MSNLLDKNILIIDDEPRIAEVIKAYLIKAGANVFTVYAGYEGLELFETHQIDLIVLDLMLPDLPGEEICRKIRKKSNVPIIMVTAKVEEADELTGLSLGADDYITKPFSNKILMARIESLLRRINQDQKMFFSDGILEVNIKNKSVKKNGIAVNLSNIELKILIELIKLPEKIFTRNELINLTLGYDFDGFDRTIDAHIKNLRKKIEENPKKPKYIITVHGIGYKICTDCFIHDPTTKSERW